MCPSGLGTSPMPGKQCSECEPVALAGVAAPEENLCRGPPGLPSAGGELGWTLSGDGL